MESKLHQHLKKIAMIKLHYMGCQVIYPEVTASYFFNGCMDAVGSILNFNKVITIGIEVKISRADYFGQKQKNLAKRESLKKDNEKDGLNYKYFLTPINLIKKSELYPGWGLMEFNGERVKKITEAPRKEADNLRTLFSMASIQHNFYHQEKSKLMGSDYKWFGYCDIENAIDFKRLGQEVFNFETKEGD